MLPTSRLAATLTFAALVAAATPTVALADERFVVSGPDLAGRATIGDDGSVTLTAERYGRGVLRNGVDDLSVEGRLLERSPSRIRFEIETREDASAWDRIRLGFRGRLLGQTIEDERIVDGQIIKMVEVTLAGDDANGFSGAVKEQAQTWRLEDELAHDLVVLVVPGLSTNLWNQNGVNYLDENIAAIRTRTGLPTRRLTINTEASVGQNAAEIAAEIRTEVDAGKRVILVAHSKGGADTITALSDPANRDLLPQIAGFIAIQPVYGGSLVSDIAADHRALQAIADRAFEVWLPAINRVDDTGSRDAVRDLRTSTRQALLARHPYPADQVPTVVIRGFMDGRNAFKPRHVLRQPLVLTQMLVEHQFGEHSDGLVALKHQRIPGSVAEHTFEDLDHFEPGFRGESPHRPVDVTHKGLDLLVPHLKPAPAARAEQPVVTRDRVNLPLSFGQQQQRD